MLNYKSKRLSYILNKIIKSIPLIQFDSYPLLHTADCKYIYVYNMCVCVCVHLLKDIYVYTHVCTYFDSGGSRILYQYFVVKFYLQNIGQISVLFPKL